jgi:glycosyltransferase involved in cell wall biosynthesis
MAKPLPLLIISDAVSAPTGFGRIAGGVASRADEHLKDVCRVATLGYGGPGSRRFKFPQYAIEGMRKDFVIPNLPEVWEDWAGDEPGVILFIWDASRLGWFSRPEVMCEDRSLRKFLTSTNFRRWIYNPVDAQGPHGGLTYPLAQTLLGFDRILAYGQWGENVMRKSLGDVFSQERDLGSIPHGVDSAIFYPRDRSASRRNFTLATGATDLIGYALAEVREDEILIGAVATNQTRKDWGLWAKACGTFHGDHPEARFWIHTDILERHWSISALLVDFGLMDRTVISLGHLTDDRMAQAYSACDLTLGIGAGEGFGYPLAESMFCGTPVIHGNYAGGVDFLPESLLVNPISFHLEGTYCGERPTYSPKDWVDKMEYLLGKRVTRPSGLDWESVWPRFERWIRDGLTGKSTNT